MKELIKLTKEIADKRNEYWLEDVVFSHQWWLLLSLTILLWVVWWKFVDKQRVLEIFLYGSIISIYAIVLDDIGAYFLLWIYKYQLVPISPRLNPIDLAVMPITFMFVYQYFKSWKSFLVVQTILAAGAAFVAEPVFIWMDIYEPLNWKFIYSFIIYLILGIGNKMFMGKLVRMQVKAG